MGPVVLEVASVAAAPAWRLAIREFRGVLIKVVASREVVVLRKVVRLALLPVRFVLGKILSGDWVPGGPWIAVWSSFAFAANVQTYKQIAGLTWRLARAQVTAWRGNTEEKSRVACELCDSIIGLILKFDSNSPEDIDCEELCPFGMKKCVRTCDAIVEAIATSSHYPCVAANLCEDEFAGASDSFGALLGGEAKCAWDKAERACAPKGVCTKTGSAPRFVVDVAPALAKCELHPGLELWGKYQSKLAQHAGALVGALQHRPTCGEEGASPLFCVQEPTSRAQIFSARTATTLVLGVGILRSVRAIETSGGDDDKLMLTFWIVFVLATLAERVLVVLLSRHPFYYHAKLLVVLFITYFDGAEYLYRKLRRLRYRVAHSSAWRKRLGPLFLPRYLHEDVSAETYAQRKARAEANAVLKLEQQAAFGALGAVADYANRTSLAEAYKAAVKNDLGQDARDALVSLWDKEEFAFLYARVHAVSGLRVAEDRGRAGGDPRPRLARSTSNLAADLDKGARLCYAEMHLVLPGPADATPPAGGQTATAARPSPPTSPVKREARRHSAVGDLLSARSKKDDVPFLRQMSTPDRTFHRRGAATARTPGSRARSRSDADTKAPEASADATPTGRLAARLERVRVAAVAFLRHTWLVEAFLGHFEDDALSSAVSELRPAGDEDWNADLELKLSGGEIDAMGKWHNPDAAYMEVLVQVWAHSTFSEDTNLGEARVPVCVLMHGGPVKVEDLVLRDARGNPTGKLTTTLRLASS